MRIVIIHQYYLRPEQGGGARFNVMARAWAEAGHDVVVIAGQVHYHTGEKPQDYQRSWRTIEHDHGVEVWRVHTPDTYARSFVGRAVAFAGFALSASLATLVAKADVVLATSPSLLVAIPGMIHQLWHRSRLVFEVRDLWPESAVATGVLRAQQPLTRALYGLEQLTYTRADIINAVTPAIQRAVEQRTDTPVWYFPNGANLQAYKHFDDNDISRLRRELGWHNHFVVLYAGAHGLANDLNQLIDAASHLKAQTNVLLVAIGDGPQKHALTQRAAALKLSNIQWLDPVASHLIPLYFMSADAGAVILQRNETFKTVYPNKLFDIMAAQKPVLCGVDGAARSLVEEAQCGVYVEPARPDKLAQNVLHLANNPDKVARLGQRGRAYVQEHFDRHTIAQQYLAALCTLEH